jgi:predicted membrane channel-forming protein YqfA (hemolysin III family)
MALIKCSECGTEISDKAAVCVKCGAPTAAAPAGGSIIEVAPRRQAGKQPKALQLIGFLVLAFGVVLAVSDAKSGKGLLNGVGPALILLGLVLYAVGRVSAWWKHG